jgi:predicted GIY-YIG superfamily endonuclease
LAALISQVPFVYILRCSVGTFGIGHTGNLASRIASCNAGIGSTCAAVRRPVELVYRESRTALESAAARERQLKRWSAEKQEALALDDSARLKQLANRGAPSP